IKAAKASRSASAIGLSEGSIFSACSIYPTYPGAEEDWKTSEEVAGTRTRIHLSCSNDGQPYNRGIGHIRASFYGPQILIKPRHNIVVSRLRSALNGDCNPRRGMNQNRLPRSFRRCRFLECPAGEQTLEI